MPSGELKSLLIFLYFIVLKSKTDKSDWFENLAGMGRGHVAKLALDLLASKCMICGREGLGKGRVHP